MAENKTPTRSHGETKTFSNDNVNESHRSTNSTIQNTIGPED
jgi:hypothetical protein